MTPHTQSPPDLLPAQAPPRPPPQPDGLPGGAPQRKHHRDRARRLGLPTAAGSITIATHPDPSPQALALSGQHRPNPAVRPPLPRPPGNASTRARLDMAFAVLRRHGIAAIPGYGFHAALSRMGIAAEVARRRPNGSGWYAFWTATDNRTHLDDEGVLTAPLTVYHHSEVGRQVAAALSDVGLTIGARGIESLVLTAGPARTGRPG